jgi:hypothetical protein
LDEAGDIDWDIHQLDVLQDLVISPVNPKYFKVNCDNLYNPINYETIMDNSYSYTNQLVSIQNKVWQPWQFSHFLIPDEVTQPYGKSMLWSMRSTFDQLTTMEALLAFCRASKIQRLVISIPVPESSSVMDAYEQISEIKSNYLTSLFTDAPGTRGGRKITGMNSIMFKPAIEGFDIDHIESNIDLSSTEDVEYFLDKILRNSKVPKGYLVGDDTITTAQTLESQDLKFSRSLLPLKKAFCTGMVHLISCILTHAGFDVSRIEIKVTINKPIEISGDLIAKYTDTIALLQTIKEANQGITKINMYQLAVEFGLPNKIAKLIFSPVNINVLQNQEDLKTFLIGQEVTVKQDDTKLPKYESFKQVETAFSLSSKEYLKHDYKLSKTLKEMCTSINDKSLLVENFIPKQIKAANDDTK